MAKDCHADAVAAFREGLTTISSLTEKYPEAFGQLARLLGRDYLAACKKAGNKPDAEVLGSRRGPAAEC
jgi:hypothetical protein